MTRLIIWGAGELGSRAARLWRNDGGEVVAFTQSNRRHPALTALGAEPRLGHPLEEIYPDKQ